MKEARLAISNMLLPEPGVCGDDWGYFCVSSSISAEKT